MVSPLRSPAVPRAVAILDFVARRGPSLASEIADGLGIARSSISNLTSTLENDRFLKRHSDGRFTLGRALGQVANGLTAGLPLTDSFIAACDKAAGLGGYTVSLDTLYCGEILCLAVRHGRLSIPLTPRPGRRLPLASSGSGQAVVAAMSAAQLREHFDTFKGMLAVPAGDVEALLVVREQIRRRRADGVVSRNAPERGLEMAHAVVTGGLVLGAVTLTAPDGYANPDGSATLARSVRQAAEYLGGAADIMGSAGPTSG